MGGGLECARPGHVVVRVHDGVRLGLSGRFVGRVLAAGPATVRTAGDSGQEVGRREVRGISHDASCCETWSLASPGSW
jgi:hypothetical protein